MLSSGGLSAACIAGRSCHALRKISKCCWRQSELLWSVKLCVSCCSNFPATHCCFRRIWHLSVAVCCSQHGLSQGQLMLHIKGTGYSVKKFDTAQYSAHGKRIPSNNIFPGDTNKQLQNQKTTKPNILSPFYYMLIWSLACNHLQRF